MGGGGILAWRRFHPEKRKLAAEAASTEARTAKDLRTEIDHLWQSWRAAEARAEKLQETFDALHAEHALLLQSFAALKGAIPVAMSVEQLLRRETGGQDVIDFMPPGWGLGVTDRETSNFLSVSQSFATILGLDKDAILGTHYLDLICEEDAERTQVIEGSAWGGPVWIVNWYWIGGRKGPRRQKVQLRWRATRYNGVALWICRKEQVVEVEREAKA